MSAIAGWYTDPSGEPGQLRWWDGAAWTDHVTPDPAVTGITHQAEDDQATAEPAGSDAAQHAEVDASAHQDAPAAEVAADETTEGVVPPSPAPQPSVDPHQPAWQRDDEISTDADAPAWAGAAAADAGAAWGSGAAASSATADAPSSTGAAATAGASGGTPPPPPAAPVWGQGGGRDEAPTWLPAEPRSGSAARTGLIVAAVVAVVFVGIVGIAFVGLFAGFGGGDFSSEFGEFDAFEGDVAAGGEVSVGDVRSGQVPGRGSFELDLIVDEPALVTVDVRGRGTFDATVEVVDEFGDMREYNDDRHDAGGGADSLDPLVEVDLEPGTYRIIVRGFGGDSGEVEVRIR